MEKQFSKQDAETTIGTALDLIAKHSIQDGSFEWAYKKVIDWNAYKEHAWSDYKKASEKTTDPRQLTLNVLDLALMRLQDNHSFILHPDYCRAGAGDWIQRKPSQTGYLKFPILKPCERDGVLTVTLPPILAFDKRHEEEGREHEYEYVAVVREILKSIKAENVEKIIVDLRTNAGGNMYPMLAAIRPLLSSETLGFFVGPSTNSFWDINTQESIYDQKHKEKDPFYLQDMPVDVLVGAQTASAGEFVALSLRGRPRTELFFSAKTYGATTCTNNLGNFLPEGKSLFPDSDMCIVLADSVGQDRKHFGNGGPLCPPEDARHERSETKPTPSDNSALRP